MINRDFIFGIFLLLIGFILFTYEYIVPEIEINNAYKLLSIPITYLGIKKLKGEKIL